jgi:hypothetical protein
MAPRWQAIIIELHELYQGEPNDSRAVTLPVFLLVVKSAKQMAILSAVLTIVCAVLVVGLEFVSWKRDGVWNSYRLSSVIESIKGDRDVTYVMASVDRQPAELTIKQSLVEWVLGIPVIALLMVAVVLHFVLYLYLTTLEKEASRR